MQHPTPYGRWPAALYTAVPLVVLAFGHTLSNLLRTLPAMANDVMSLDMGTTTALLGLLTGAYHLFFALGQLPAGVMLDRLGVRTVSLSLFATTALGCIAAALARGPVGFFVAQALLGIGCCGMLLCPFALAARTLPPARFALWSGFILSIGNCGMLLSATPVAWLIERHGWRASFWVATAMALGIGVLVALVVPRSDRAAAPPARRLGTELREVLTITASPSLRGPVVLAFTSLAAVLAVRGVWGGPWFMEVKGLSRIDAGNALIPLTLAVAIGPLVAGTLDRLTGARRALLAGSHLAAGGLLLVVVAAATLGDGPPHGWHASASFDAWVFFIFGCCMSTQPLLFAMGQSATPRESAGKALAALNLMFFCGTAFHQLASGAIASAFGLAPVFAYFALFLGASSLLFLRCTRRAPAPLDAPLARGD